MLPPASEGGQIFEAVAAKYGRQQLRVGRQYTAALVRGRSFAFEPGIFGGGRLVPWVAPTPEPEPEDGSGAGSTLGMAGPRGKAELVRLMFAGKEGEEAPSLQPGGSYYKLCARTLGNADGAGPLDPRIEYKVTRTKCVLHRVMR